MKRNGIAEKRCVGVRVALNPFGRKGNLGVGIGRLAFGNGPEQHDGIASPLEVRGDSKCYIVKNAHDAEYRGWIDAFAPSLVVERNIAAGNGRGENRAGFGDAVD